MGRKPLMFDDYFIAQVNSVVEWSRTEKAEFLGSNHSQVSF